MLEIFLQSQTWWGPHGTLHKYWILIDKIQAHNCMCKGTDPGGSFNIKILSYQFRNSLIKIRWSYDYTDNTASFHWIGPQQSYRCCHRRGAWGWFPSPTTGNADGYDYNQQQDASNHTPDDVIQLVVLFTLLRRKHRNKRTLWTEKINSDLSNKFVIRSLLMV